MIFVYDAGGKLVAEYSTQLSQTPQTQYLTNDHLGSPRINTNELANVVSRSDYLPYGEEIVGLGGRSSSDKYVSDDVRQGFTGYLKDDETGLDFAQARMYKKELARFTGADPLYITDERLSDPQRINLYVYVRNNPLILVDSSGQDIDDEGLKDNKDYQTWKAAFRATDEGKRLWDKYENNKNFTLKIVWKEGSNGALTDNYKFKDGKLVGATITLGDDIDNREAASGRGTDYPLQTSLGKADVDKTTMAVAVIAHEFGHVEDADARPNLFQGFQEYEDLKRKKTEELGNPTAAYEDAEVQKKETSVLKAFKVHTWSQLSTDTDRRAEKTAILVTQQHFANTGQTVPKSVQKAITNLWC